MSNMVNVTEPPKPNFEWMFSDIAPTIAYRFGVKRTLPNRWKWWVSTKLFLPGSYTWLEKPSTPPVKTPKEDSK